MRAGEIYPGDPNWSKVADVMKFGNRIESIVTRLNDTAEDADATKRGIIVDSVVIGNEKISARVEEYDPKKKILLMNAVVEKTEPTTGEQVKKDLFLSRKGDSYCSYMLRDSKTGIEQEVTNENDFIQYNESKW